jgi:hypothetical protein
VVLSPPKPGYEKDEPGVQFDIFGNGFYNTVKPVNNFRKGKVSAADV